jgi:hypothetical protein
MTIINKAVCFLLLCFVVTLFVSCPTHDPDPSYVNIYPSDIEIPGYGTLKYTETLWDGKNQGTEIFDAVKFDNEMWIYTRDNVGFYINKGVSQSNENRIRLKNDYSYWSMDQVLITNGDYVLLFAETREYKPFKELSYLTRIHKDFLTPEYFKAFNEEDYDSSYVTPHIYYGNDDVFLIFYEDKDSLFYISPECIYKLNNACDKFVKSTEEAFNNFLSQNKNIIMDDNGIYRQIELIKDEKGRLYRINNFGFEVSVDDGQTWHSGDMGTNLAISIIIQNDTIYFICSADWEWASSWGTKSVGGGIHLFKWEKE